MVVAAEPDGAGPDGGRLFGAGAVRRPGLLGPASGPDGGRLFRAGVPPGSEDPGLHVVIVVIVSSIGCAGPAASCTRVACAASVSSRVGSCHSAGSSPATATTKYSPAGNPCAP